MSTTTIGWGSPLAAKKWSAVLSLDVNHEGFFTSRFVGKGQNFCIEEKTELEGDSGDEILFDLRVALTQEPTFGDARLDGREESMRFHSDRIRTEQVRHGASVGGRMSRKRTNHELRMQAKNALKEYWAKFKDEIFYTYLSGDRGHNEDFVMAEGFSGFGGNALRAPDADHLLFGGNATSKATIDAADTMSATLIERAETKSRMMRATNREAANMQPLNINGAKHYVVVMSPLQETDMRKDIGTTGWMELAKAAAAAEGRASPIFKGGLGMVKGVVLHSHEGVIRRRDAGAGANVPMARALFLGAQAGVCAHGTASSSKYLWHEETKDHGNEPVISAGTIYGAQKTQFDGKDFGIIALDTAAANAA